MTENKKQISEKSSSLVDINYHHWFEDWLPLRPVRWLLGRLGRPDGDGTTPLERIVETYHADGVGFWTKLKYWPIHLLMSRLRGRGDIAEFRRRLCENKPILRGIVIVARSVAEFGLTVPQIFAAPLFVVWNFTNRCNLACRHCYQDSGQGVAVGELTLDEKLSLVDQLAAASVPMLAFSGGEPTISPDLIPVIHRAKQYGMHMTLATNGTMITPSLAGDLAAAGMRYVEISLDSTDADNHDNFRGVKGMWQKALAGAEAVLATEGLRLGIAMCVCRENFHEVRDMIALAERVGASCFAHFNFIPVGRGREMIESDISPDQRQQLLDILNEKMQEGGIGIISTAPQLGRLCLAGSPSGDEKVTCSHAGSGSGLKARVVAKYLGGCGAGRTYVCIEPDGSVTPCVYMPQRVMGSVRDKPLVEIFRSNEFWEVLNDRTHRLGHCGICEFKNYCGGCRARADAYFNQIHAPDPGCVFNEKYWRELKTTAPGIGIPGLGG